MEHSYFHIAPSTVHTHNPVLVEHMNPFLWSTSCGLTNQPIAHIISNLLLIKPVNVHSPMKWHLDYLEIIVGSSMDVFLKSSHPCGDEPLCHSTFCQAHALYLVSSLLCGSGGWSSRTGVALQTPRHLNSAVHLFIGLYKRAALPSAATTSPWTSYVADTFFRLRQGKPACIPDSADQQYLTESEIQQLNIMP